MTALMRQLYPPFPLFRRVSDFLTPQGALLVCALFLLVGVLILDD